MCRRERVIGLQHNTHTKSAFDQELHGASIQQKVIISSIFVLFLSLCVCMYLCLSFFSSTKEFRHDAINWSD